MHPKLGGARLQHFLMPFLTRHLAALVSIIIVPETHILARSLFMSKSIDYPPTILATLLPRDAMIVWCISWPCVCLSVRLSQIGVLSKRLNVGSNKRTSTIVYTGKGVGLATRWSQVRFPSAATNTGMGDRLRAGKPPQYFTKPTRSTQPPTLSGTGNQCQTKCGDAVRLGSKGRYGSFHLWINMWVAGKTV